jgi:disulfide bond formation protein DsbB
MAPGPAHTGTVVRTVEFVTSVLALVAAGGAIAVLAVFLLGDRLAFAHPLAARVHHRRTDLTFAISGIATLGSLYFSEVEHFVPCRLCWFQRVMMYPIALISLIALVRRDRSVHLYTVPLAVVGAAISLYHYLIEWGVLADSESCSLFGPACAEVWFRQFGFVTLAFMALCGFFAIVVINLVPAPAGTVVPEESS